MAIQLYSGGSFYDDAYKRKYGDAAPSFEQDYGGNTAWFAKKGLLRDQALIDQGYQYYEGSADTSADVLRKAGWITAGEAGSTLQGGQNAWYYKAPTQAKSSGGSKS